MLSILRNTPIQALEQTAVFAERRHELLAGNVANIDTPGYEARDLSVPDFQSLLSQAIQKADFPSSSSRTTNDPFAELQDSMETVLRHDGTAVSMERQVTELAKNQHMHQMAVSLMRSQFQLLKTAISERPS